MDSSTPKLAAIAVVVFAAGTWSVSDSVHWDLVLDVEIPVSRKLQDLSAVLYNRGAGSVFLDPIYPPATALLQYYDPAKERWVTVPRPIRCAVVEDRAIEIKPGIAFVPEVLFERHTGDYTACLEFEKVRRRQQESAAENQTPRAELPNNSATCDPPEMAVHGRQLRLRMVYSTSKWSLSSNDIQRQTIYSQVFSLEPGPAN